MDILKEQSTQKPDAKTIFLSEIKYFLHTKHALLTFELMDILPEKLIIDNNKVYNKNYDNVKIQFISLYYSVQNKCYMWLGIDDNIIYILYAENDLQKLPYVSKIDIKKLIDTAPNHIAYDIFVDGKKRRSMLASFKNIYDLTIKPYQVLKLKDIY